MEYVEITPEQQKAYLESPNTCPFCGSEELNGGHADFGDATCFRDVICYGCGKTWTEHFNLSEISEAFACDYI